jgi:hypothetical protein
LEGSWLVERSVRDLRTELSGAFHGEAHFTREEPGGPLLHAESGRFTWDGVTRQAERGHRFEPADDGTAHVRFLDGRFFHDLDLRGGCWTAHHPCAPDSYRGEFEVRGPDEWHVTWTVTGPVKDLVMVTVQHRI